VDQRHGGGRIPTGAAIQPADQLAFGIDDDADRNAVGVQQSRRIPGRVQQDRQIFNIMASVESLHGFEAVHIDGNRQHEDLALGQALADRSEGRQFRHARPAPGRPDIHHQPAAAITGKAQGLAGGIGESQIRRRRRLDLLDLTGGIRQVRRGQRLRGIAPAGAQG